MCSSPFDKYKGMSVFHYRLKALPFLCDDMLFIVFETEI